MGKSSQNGGNGGNKKTVIMISPLKQKKLKPKK